MEDVGQEKREKEGDDSDPKEDQRYQSNETTSFLRIEEKFDALGWKFQDRSSITLNNIEECNGIPLHQIWITVGSSIAYFIIGLVRAFSASALPSMAENDNYLLTSIEAKSWIGAIPPVGAFLGSILTGKLMQAFGRKRTIEMAAPLMAVAWTWLALSQSFINVIMSRFLCGFCVGVVLPTTQVYIGECCSAEIRGRLSSIPALVMSFGILMSYIIGAWVSWRELAWFSVIISGILLAALLPLPESPVWLDGKGRTTQSRDALEWLHLPPTHENIGMNNKIKPTNGMENAKGDSDIDNKPTETEESLFTRKVFFSSSILKPLGVGMTLLVFQQVSGIDAIIFFTVEIFKSSGSSLNGHLATIIVGLVQLISNGVSTVLIDKAGRRPLLMISGSVMLIANSAMGYAFYIDLTKSEWLGYLPLVSLITFMIGFSLGFGGIPFVLLGELFPRKHRSALSAFAASLNLLTMFGVIKTYHVFETYLTSAGTFWLYASFCAVSVLFVALCVPETKGKTLQEIEKHFRSSSPREKQEAA